MALFVTLFNGDTFEHHIGRKAYFSVSEVNEVQADGHELDWITQWFNGSIPCHKGRVMNWYGDTAKMIAKALYYLDK